MFRHRQPQPRADLSYTGNRVSQIADWTGTTKRFYQRWDGSFVMLLSRLMRQSPPPPAPDQAPPSTRCSPAADHYSEAPPGKATSWWGAARMMHRCVAEGESWDSERVCPRTVYCGHDDLSMTAGGLDAGFCS